MVLEKFNDLKENIANNSLVDFNVLSKYIDNLLFTGVFSKNSHFRKYCIMSSCLTTRFTTSDEAAMYVSLEGDKIYLNINPFLLIDLVDNEEQIFFIMAHEMKHIMLNHLQKYNYMFCNDVVSQIMNIATDYEVNTNLIKELEDYKQAVPKRLVSDTFICELCRVDINYLSAYIENNKYGTPADCIFNLINNYTEKVLGYDIHDILYRCKIFKTDFNKEVFNVADGLSSNVFYIKDNVEARRFCRIIASFLKDKRFYLILLPVNKDNNALPGSSKNSSKENIPSNAEGKGNSIQNIGSIPDLFDLQELLDSVNGLYELLSSTDSFSKLVRTRGKEKEEKKVISRYEYVSEVSWQGVLRKTCFRLSENYKRSKKKINRRQPYRLELSGSVKKSKFSIVIAIDESSSILDEECNYFLSELYTILSNFDCDVFLYEFTSSVERYTEITNRRSIKKVLAGLNGESFTRCSGGTSYQPVFDAIKDNKKINQERTLVVFFTDGEGETDVDFYNCKKRMWITIGSKEKDVSCGDKDNVYPLVKITRK